MALVLFIIFAESGLLIGFFLPGDSLIFTLGLLIQGTATFKLGLDIRIVALLLFLAAILGDNVGYLFGRKVGPHIFNRQNSLFFKRDNIKKAQDFYEKHGGKTIILARFVPIVRTFAPIVAGVGKMRYKTFFLFNIIGGFLWTNGVLFLGYYLGYFLTKAGVNVDSVLLPIIILILLLSVSPAIYQLLKTKEKRQIALKTIKQQLKKLLKRR